MTIEGTGTRRWQRRGGGLVIAAFVLEGAGLLGYYLTNVRAPQAGVILADGLPLLAATALVLAVFTLTMGTNGTDGIVGSSRTGKTALIAWGVFTLLSRVANLGFFTLGVGALDNVGGVVRTCAVVAVITGAVASVVIYRARIATGAARWALMVVVLLQFAALALTGMSNTLSWVIAGLGIISGLLLGLIWTRAATIAQSQVRTPVENLAE